MSLGLPSASVRIATVVGLMESVWYEWASRVTGQLNRDWGVGTTATRPTGSGIRAGDRYFDTTLGLPIWFDGAIWIKADGTAA